MRCLASAIAATYRLLPLGYLGVQPAHLLRQMLTVQNPKKPWLAVKPACSLVDNASLGLQLPPSGSGCLSLEGDGLQPAISVQSFCSVRGPGGVLG